MLIKNKHLRDSIARTVTLFFSGINRLIPKDPNRILFYTNTGIKDNLKAMLDNMAKTPDGYRLICSCDSTAGLPYGVTAISNFKGLFAFLRSGTVFYYNGKIPIKPAPKQTVVNLWHGIPLKKIGRMLDDKDIDFATHYLAPSLYTGELMQQAFGCTPDKILYNGLPRCDLLFDAPSAKDACRLLGFDHCDHLIGWMPTFRNAAVSNINDSDLKSHSATGLPLLHDHKLLQACNELLREKQTLLWIKLHPSETGFPDNGTFSNILIQSDTDFRALNIDYYRLLGSCEALISDYSSVYFDYLLLDRPLGFAIEDIDSYQNSRGFTAKDPIAQMPGEILEQPSQFFAFLEAILSDKPDPHREARRKIKELYCGKTDPHAADSLREKLNLKGE